MMKSLIWKAPLLTIFGWLALWGTTTPMVAAEEDVPRPEARLQRMEQRINELAQRQEQMIRRLDAAREQPNLGRRDPQQNRPEMLPGANAANPHRPMALAGAPVPAVAKDRKSMHDLLGLLFLVAVFCNILLAVWIFTDIRKRGEGSGLFIAMALVAGIPAAIIYALVRIGDKKAGASA